MRGSRNQKHLILICLIAFLTRVVDSWQSTTRWQSVGNRNAPREPIGQSLTPSRSPPTSSAPPRISKFKSTLRTISPLFFAFLPMLAPSPMPQHRMAWAAGEEATVATMESSGSDSSSSSSSGQRLMGKVQPIDKLAPEAEGIFKRGRIAETDNDFEKALRLYDRLTRVAPGYAYAWSNKGNAYIALGELENALDSYSRAIELLPTKTGDAWLVYLNRATTELALNKLQDCLSDLDEARILRGQPDVLLFANKGIALERQGNYVGALENYENAVITKPKDVSPWWLRYSLVLFEQKQDIKSIEIMRKVAAKFSRVDEIRAALSTIVYAYGDQNEAERIWSELEGQAQYKYRDKTFLKEKLRWPPRMIQTLSDYKGLYTPTKR